MAKFKVTVEGEYRALSPYGNGKLKKRFKIPAKDEPDLIIEAPSQAHLSQAVKRYLNGEWIEKQGDDAVRVRQFHIRSVKRLTENAASAAATPPPRQQSAEAKQEQELVEQPADAWELLNKRLQTLNPKELRTEADKYEIEYDETTSNDLLIEAILEAADEQPPEGGDFDLDNQENDGDGDDDIPELDDDGNPVK